MSMTLGRLKELLDEIEGEEGVDDETYVYVGHQPSYPLAMGIAGVRHWSQQERECPDHEGYIVDHDEACADRYALDLEELKDTDNERVIWIVLSEGSPYERSPYAPRWLWED